MNRPLEPATPAAPTREALAAALAEKERALAAAAARQEATAEILRIIGGSKHDAQPVFEAIVLAGVRLLHCDVAGLFECDGAVYSPAAGADPTGLITLYGPSKVPIDPAATFPSRAIVSKQLLEIPDWSRLDLPPVERAVREASGLNSTIYLPLLRENACVALLVFGSKQANNFGPEEIAIAESFRDHALIAIENARLFEEVRAKTRDLSEALQQQTATADVLKVISRSAFDLQTVLDTLVRSAVELVGSAHGSIHIRDGAEFPQRANFGFASKEIASLVRQTPMSPGRGTLTGRVALSGKVEAISDILEDSEFNVPWKGSLPVRSLLGVPLLRENRVEGTMILGRVKPGSFTPREVELAQTFADQALIAIENARLFDEVQAKTRDLSEALQQQTATADVLKVISRSAFDVQTVLDTLVKSAAQLCEAEKACIFLRRGETFHWQANYGFSQALVDYAQTHPFTAGGHSATSRVARDRRAVHIPDVLADPDYTASEYQRLGNYRTMLGVPLLREGEPVGVFIMTREAVRPFKPRQIDLLQTFADQAVIAIENARLFDEVQARTHDLTEALQQQTATAEVLKVISRSAFGLQTVLQTLVDTAVRFCAADGVIYLRHGDIFVAEASYDADASGLARKRMPRRPGRESVTGRVALSGQIEQIPDNLADPEFAVPTDQRMKMRSLIGVPLLRDGAVEGVFVLGRPEPGLFSERAVELVKGFADQAVIAIQNVRLFEALQAKTHDLEETLDGLRKAQDRLIQSEKLASLGQLTAGIAHEIKNPLNFVNNFSGLSRELIDELREVLGKALLEADQREEIDDLLGMLSGNLEKVVSHGKRADSIVKNMLLHSREGSGERRPVAVNAMLEEALNLAYHGARAEKPGFNVTIEKALDPNAGFADLYAQEMTRVILNLISNAFYATTKRKQSGADASYEPAVKASTRDLGPGVEIVIRDNGTGIPAEVQAKMFNPFFTTKPAGEGTGLGLSLSHDIVVKQHGGTLDVATEPGAFTEFTIRLPRSLAKTGAAS